MKRFGFFAVVFFGILCSQAWAAIIADGDFVLWNFSATGDATVSREITGGNPDNRLNITTVSGPTVFGLAIKADFSTNLQLENTPFVLQLDVLSGPGSFGNGQKIQLLVEQNSNIYGYRLDDTGYPLNWDTLSFQGVFTGQSFDLLRGFGPVTPDLSGGIDTFFGFAGGNTISGTLTQYYDNFNLEITPVPVPSAIWLFTTVIISFLGVRTHNTRQKAAM